ncbi:hypothetical protein RRG08_002643 [Elysia crispata]|uniref:Uncharacterized protein n=1 Tax=Elysia crispata TaxID=231223 RepID=A0AAE1CSL7_9GAST|nr:hypothetical protein RRG08_002643 [Elysia crispata]
MVLDVARVPTKRRQYARKPACWLSLHRSPALGAPLHRSCGLLIEKNPLLTKNKLTTLSYRLKSLYLLASSSHLPRQATALDRWRETALTFVHTISVLDLYTLGEHGEYE